jgi:hypothetical protein
MGYFGDRNAYVIGSAHSIISLSFLVKGYLIALMDSDAMVL